MAYNADDLRARRYEIEGGGQSYQLLSIDDPNGIPFDELDDGEVICSMKWQDCTEALSYDLGERLPARCEREHGISLRWLYDDSSWILRV